MNPDPKEVERIVKAALAEDIGKGDVTANLLVPASAKATLFFINREPIVVCGTMIVARVFAAIDSAIHVKAFAQDGNHLPARAPLLTVTGNARAILTAERTALNLLQRMSSVATLTARYVSAAQGTKAVILDTRKTMPGLRVLDKYAVRTGGGQNHRMRLDDGILIKDNHIALCGGVAETLKRAEAGNHEALPIEVECDTLAQVSEALAAGAKAILLDNMDLSSLREAVSLSKGRAKLEASGNVTLEAVPAIAATGVDYISAGRLTHSVPNVDIGLDVTINDV